MAALLARIQLLAMLHCVFFFTPLQARSSSFTCSSYPSLVTGLTVMGAPTTSSNSRSIQVKRGSTFLSSGDAYVAGESLTIVLSSTSGDVILESSGGAAFQSGQCSGNKRYYGSSQTLVMPTGASLSAVEVWGAWATAHGQVSISTHFSLSAPVLPPTSLPSSAPSSPAPTTSPSALPTPAPSFTPSHTPSTSQPTSPSRLPTSYPTSQPVTSRPTLPGETHLPTATPSSLPSVDPTTLPSSSPSPQPSTCPSSLPSPVPVTSPPTTLPSESPVASPSFAPSLFPTRAGDDDAVMFSLAVTAITSGDGVTVETMQGKSSVLGGTICAHLGLKATLCLVAFIGDAPPLSATGATPLSAATVGTSINETYDISFTVLVNGFSSNASAVLAKDKLRLYLSESPSVSFASYDSVTAFGSGFIADFATNSGVQLLGVDYLTGTVSDVSAGGGEGGSSRLGYSCDITDSLRLSWEVVSVGDGITVGRPGGLVYMSLLMEKSTAGSVSPWFGGGIVSHDTLSMVASSGSGPNVVYLYLPSRQAVGEYIIGGYSASGIAADTRHRVDAGIVGVATTTTAQAISILRSRLTGVEADPALQLDSEAGFNTFMWAHGGTWPGQHSGRSSRGFSDVYWLSGECVATPEAESITWVIFVSVFVALLLGSSFMVRIRAPKVCTFFQSSIGLYVPLSCMQTEVIGLSISAVLFCLLFLATVFLYIVVSAQFYIEEKGYDATRAYGSATGYAALFLVSITTLPVSKTSLWLRLLHIPYDQATKFHRWCAMLTVSLITLHLFITASFWGLSNALSLDLNKQIGAVYPAFGCLAFGCFWLMAITASYPMRVWSYELFQHMHLVCFVFAVLFIALHASENYVGTFVLLVPLLLYATDWCCRLYQQISPVQVISATSTAPGYAQITIAAKHISSSKVQPGNYCFLHIREANGLCQYQWHPISICKYDKNTQEMTFVIKDVGNWTRKVCALVRDKSLLTVRMYGPYGKLSVELGPNSDGVVTYNTIVFIAGGIGITPMLAILDWLVDEVAKYPPAKKKSKTLKEQFGRYASLSATSIEIEICLFCTISPPLSSSTNLAPPVAVTTSSKKVVPLQETGCSGTVSSLPVAVTYSRPNFKELLLSIMQKEKSNDTGEDRYGRMAVLVCGPGPVVSTVQQACFSLQTQFGCESVTLHQESFCL